MRERMRRGDGHVLRRGDQSHVAVELRPVQNVVRHVEHRDARVSRGRQDARLDELRRAVAVGADRADLARVDQPLTGREGVFQKPTTTGGGVERQHVDAVGPETGERGFDRAHEVDRVEARMIGMAADAHGQNRVVARPSRAQPLAEDELAAPCRIAVGRVQGVAAELGVGVEDLVALAGVDVPAELAAAEEEGEDREPGLAERTRTCDPRPGPGA